MDGLPQKRLKRPHTHWHWQKKVAISRNLSSRRWARFAAVISRGDLPTASAITSQLLDLSKREGSAAALGLAHACGVTSCYCQGDLTGAEKQFVAGATMFKDAGRKFPLRWLRFRLWKSRCLDDGSC